MSTAECEVQIPPDGLSAVLTMPPGARAIMPLAHGAGAGKSHQFMADLAGVLSDAGIAALRYNFPYMDRAESGGRRFPPDRPPVLVRAVRAAVACAAELSEGLPLLAGGKSLGGRMTTTAAASGGLPGVRGIVLFGFPLHPPGRPEMAARRAAHLPETGLPMLFLQGSRDALGKPHEVSRTIRGIRGAELREIESADHSFGVPKRSGRTKSDVIRELVEITAEWAGGLIPE